ncbi:MAG: hypothetical protein AAGN82_19925 [Myxococcota bacterium]
MTQASPGLDADGLLSRALMASGLDQLPPGAAALSGFVLGPLYDGLAAATTPETAARVVKILRPILRRRSELEFSVHLDAERALVLVLADDIIVRAQTLAILNAAGYQGVSAPDANVALALSVRFRPDVIVSAVDPAVDGGRLVGLLSVAFADAPPPLVLVTDGPQDPTLVAGLTVLRKPIRRDLLLAAVDRLAGARRSSLTG